MPQIMAMSWAMLSSFLFQKKAQCDDLWRADLGFCGHIQISRKLLVLSVFVSGMFYCDSQTLRQGQEHLQEVLSLELRKIDESPKPPELCSPILASQKPQVATCSVPTGRSCQMQG